MKHTTMVQLVEKGLFVLLALFFVSEMTIAQTVTDLNLNGNIVNNGTIRVNRNIVNRTTGPVSVTGPGVVVFRGSTAGAHAVRCTNISDTYPVSLIRLDLTGSRITTLNVNTTVTDRLRIGDGTTAYTAGGAGFTIGSQTLTIGALSSYMATSNAALTFNGGTVVFNSGAAQSILNKATGVTYGTLTLSGAGAKSVTTGGTVTAASLTQTGGQLSVAENIDVTGTGSFDDLGAISAAKRLRLTAVATSGSVTAMSNSGTGTFENAANIGVTIGTLSSNVGTIQNSGAGSIAFTNAAASNGTITNTSTGTVDFNNDLAGTGTISQTAGGTIEVGGALTQNTYSLSNGTVVYNSNAVGQSVIGTTYTNLTLNSGTKTLSAPATVTGSLTLDGSSAMDMNGNNMSVASNLTLGSNITTGASGTLTMTSTTAGNVTGIGEVLGSVKRAHDFTSGQNYRFNRADVWIGTANSTGSSLSLTMKPATSPTTPVPTDSLVMRQYLLGSTGTTGNIESLQLYYANSEATAIYFTGKIGVRTRNAGTWNKLNNAGYTRTSGSNLVSLSGLNNSLTGVTELGMFKVNYQTFANGSDISTNAGWDENSVPTSTDDAVIKHTGVVTGASAVNIGWLTIDAGKSLSTNGAGLLTVANSTTVDGTLNITNANADVKAITIGSAGVVSVNSGRTLTGTSLTNNSSNASTFTGNVSLSSLDNAGTGALSFNGSASTITGSVTNSNASSAISVGGTLSMMTSSELTLTSVGSMSVTGASGWLKIGNAAATSHLVMSGSSVLSVASGSKLDVYGSLTIGEGGPTQLDNNGEINIGDPTE